MCDCSPIPRFRFAPPSSATSPTEMKALSKPRAYRKANQGMAAIEFAIAMPVLLILCFGGVEVMDGVTSDSQVSLVA